ncbi:MAG: hypothetical protein KC474_11580 [Cyanobacteria bacterium HKST-UBA04]|nr:hypothetical protein [Cyanobacteria bacterium HKST-UBA04]
MIIEGNLANQPRLDKAGWYGQQAARQEAQYRKTSPDRYIVDPLTVTFVNPDRFESDTESTVHMGPAYMADLFGYAKATLASLVKQADGHDLDDDHPPSRDTLNIDDFERFFCLDSEALASGDDTMQYVQGVVHNLFYALDTSMDHQLNVGELAQLFRLYDGIASYAYQAFPQMFNSQVLGYNINKYVAESLQGAHKDPKHRVVDLDGRISAVEQELGGQILFQLGPDEDVMRQLLQPILNMELGETYGALERAADN